MSNKSRRGFLKLLMGGAAGGFIGGAIINSQPHYDESPEELLSDTFGASAVGAVIGSMYTAFCLRKSSHSKASPSDPHVS